MDAQR